MLATTPGTIKPLLLTTSLNIGGAERSLLNLARMLGRDEMRRAYAIEPHFSAIGGASVFGNNTLIADAQALTVPTLLLKTRRFYDPSALRTLRRYIIDHEINVLHSFLIGADIQANLLGRLLSMPVVTSLRNVPTSYFNARADQRWLFKTFALGSATNLVALSDSIRNEWISAAPGIANRIVTIPNAAAIERYVDIPIVRDTEARPFTVTTVGRLMPQKAHHDLLLAAKKVLQSRANIRFQIIGHGTLENELKAQAAQLGIEHAVSFLGNRDDIDQIHAHTDVFVLSSHWEGMSVAAIEAMAAALPCVLTNVGANTDLITHREEGLIVPVKNPSALASAILELEAEPALRHRLGKAARLKALSNYSADANCEAYIKLYQQVIHNKAR